MYVARKEQNSRNTELRRSFSPSLSVRIWLQSEKEETVSQIDVSVFLT